MEEGRYQSFVCLVSLDFLDGESPTDKMVQVHPIVYERACEKGWGIEQSCDLQFQPTKMSLNQTESSFVLYGDRGILVGNFPSMLQNFRQKRTDSQNLELPPSDLEIDCEVVAFDELDKSETLSVVQAEFAVQNTNYLSVLFHEFDVP